MRKILFSTFLFAGRFIFSSLCPPRRIGSTDNYLLKLKNWLPVAISMMLVIAINSLAHAQTNIAPQATVSASSTSTSHPVLYFPSRANDGEIKPDAWREWSNNSPASEQSPAWLMYTWPSMKNIRKVVVHTHIGWELQDFKVEYSLDGTTWYTFPGGKIIGNLEVSVEVLANSAVAAKHLRILATRGPEIQPGVVRITELEVFEDNPSFDLPIPPFVIHDLQPRDPISRARRPVVLTAELKNTSSGQLTVVPHLKIPIGGVIYHSPSGSLNIPEGGSTLVSWLVEFDHEGTFDVQATVADVAGATAQRMLRLRVLPPVAIKRTANVPEPIPAVPTTDTLVGALNFPYWSTNVHDFWLPIEKFRERMPALGLYGQETAEVNEWELKWAAEHGINFFVYNWTRFGRESPASKWSFPFNNNHIVRHLSNSKFTNQVKAVLQFNNGTGESGVENGADLNDNIAPYFIETFFKSSDYLKVDNKPVLFIYDIHQLIEDFGGEAKVAAAFEEFRRKCRKAGFEGLYVIGEHRFYEVPQARGRDYEAYRKLKSAGVDYVFAYNNYIGGSPDPKLAVKTQMEYYQRAREFNLIPPILTASMGWSGWRNENTVWQLPPRGPDSYQSLLEQIRDTNATLPEESGLSKKMVLLDNWNEWSEGHYIAPHRQHGFDYLDAVREVFAPNGSHQDLIPEDLEMGPYDKAFWDYWNRDEAVLQPMAATKALGASPLDPDLVGWWNFDEEQGTKVAFDLSGNRLGGIIRGTNATRVNGWSGKSLQCRGGACVTIASDDKLSPARITVSAWVWTTNGSQNETYVLNRMYLGNDSGYRLSVSEGKPVFTVPMDGNSNSLVAKVALPTNRWVHLAGSCDGKTVRIYVDGVEQGSMVRWGKVTPNDAKLLIGNFAEGAGPASAFDGLIDDVRIYRRALSAADVSRIASSDPQSAPTATDSFTSVVENRAKPISLIGSHPEKSTIINFPSHGTLTGRSSQWIYTPDRNFKGTDSFTFKLSDGLTESKPARVSIIVLPGATDGLEGWWPMDEATGTVVPDETGLSKYGRVAGGTWVPGKVGGALQFDDKKGGVTIPSSEGLDGVRSMTIAGWVRVDEMPSSQVCPFTKEGSESAYRMIFNNEGRVQFVVATANNRWYSKGTHANAAANTISVGSWKHFAGTYDGRRVRLYVDGRLVGSATDDISGPIIATNSPLTLGVANPGVGVEGLKGGLDDVRFYNRALSEAEIQELFGKVAYPVSYDDNGKTGGIVPAPQSKTHNAALNLATNSGSLEKAGYSFDGWNTATDGSGRNYAEGEKYTENRPLTLYAKWKPNTYPVSYNDNGRTGGIVPAPQSKIHDTALTLATNSGNLERTGYTFYSWNTASDGSGRNYSEGERYTENTPLTLHAKWKPNIYLVSYDNNGKTGGIVPAPQSKTHDAALILATNSGNLERTGYTFDGWNTATNGSGWNYAEGETYTENSPVTLYPKWKQITYPISYDDNGKTGGTVPAPQSKTYGAALNIASNSGGLVKDGYTFVGWNTAADGSGRNYAEGDTYSDNRSVILYAKWKAVSYSITYDDNGKTKGSLPAAQSKIHDTELTLATNIGNLERTGYTFDGWNTAADGSGQNYAEGGKYTENRPLTLYAKWKPVGLVGWWQLNEKAGSTVSDSSEFDHAGLQLGGFWEGGKMGGALRLSGSRSGVTIPDRLALDGMSAMTISGWVYFSQMPTRNVSLVGKESTDNPAFRIFIAPDGLVHFAVATTKNGWYGRGNSVNSGTKAIEPGVWKNVVGTYDGSLLRLYVDGVLVSEGNTRISGPIVDNDAQLTFGIADPEIDVEAIKGSLDDFRLYNRALSAEEIRELVSPKLVGHWLFNEIVGPTVSDSSGFGYNGLQRGGSWESGRLGGALRLDGNNSGVIVPDYPGLDGMSALTVGGWVYFPQMPSRNVSLVSKEGTINPAFRIFIAPNGLVHFAVATTMNRWYGRGNSINSRISSITPSAWKHVIGTYDGRLLRIYVDGILVGEGNTAISGPIVENDAKLTFGVAEPQIEVDALKGSLDNIQIYNRALSVVEIQELVLTTTPKF